MGIHSHKSKTIVLMRVHYIMRDATVLTGLLSLDNTGKFVLINKPLTHLDESYF